MLFYSLIIIYSFVRFDVGIESFGFYFEFFYKFCVYCSCFILWLIGLLNIDDNNSIVDSGRDSCDFFLCERVVIGKL